LTEETIETASDLKENREASIKHLVLKASLGILVHKSFSIVLTIKVVMNLKAEGVIEINY
jgi:hypothetical protein